jgi:hypothetical protein
VLLVADFFGYEKDDLSTIPGKGFGWVSQGLGFADDNLESILFKNSTHRLFIKKVKSFFKQRFGLFRTDPL